MELPGGDFHAFGVLQRALLFGGELLCGAADLAHRDGNLTCSLSLLNGRQQALVQFAPGRTHQLDDLVGVLAASLGGEDCRIGLVLNVADDLANRCRRANAPLGQLANFGGHDRKPPPSVAGAGRLNCGVESQDVGLLCDIVDQLEDLADLLAALAERKRPLSDPVDLLLHLLHRVAGLVRRAVAALRIGRDRCRRGSELVDRGCRLGDRRGLLVGRRSRLTDRGPHLQGRLGQPRHRRAQAVKDTAQHPHHVPDQAHRNQHRDHAGDDPRPPRTASGTPSSCGLGGRLPLIDADKRIQRPLDRQQLGVVGEQALRRSLGTQCRRERIFVCHELAVRSEDRRPHRNVVASIS